MAKLKLLIASVSLVAGIFFFVGATSANEVSVSTTYQEGARVCTASEAHSYNLPVTSCFIVEDDVMGL